MNNTVLITGGSGFIGKQLTELLLQKGYKIAILSRTHKESNDQITYYRWNVATGFIESEALLNADYIIHLAGANIADKRWTKKRKQEIIDSRVASTNLIYDVLFRNPNKLKAFISASAIGYYGVQTSQHIFTENDKPASDFFGQTCAAWEASVDKIKELGIRTVKLRIGVVLGKKDSALQKMAQPFKFGFGAIVGTGKQYMPWIHIEDLCRLFYETLTKEKYQGVYNAVVGDGVTNKMCSRVIANTLGKKMWLPPVPPFMLKLMLGEMSTILLNGSRVSSAKIKKEGFQFEYSNAEKTIAELLKKS